MTETIGNLTAGEIFLIVGILLMASEIVVSGFIMLPMGIAFIVTAAFSLVVKPWWALLVILAVAEIAVFLAFRRLRVQFLTRPKVYTNVEGMIGRECVVIEEIRPDAPGYVKLYGDQWQALSQTGEPIAKGARVTIVNVDGNKVFVESIQ